MKKWRTIVAVSVFAILALSEVGYDFVTNDPIGYFWAQPPRLLYVAALGIVGGLAALGFCRLSSSARWQVRLSGWGAAAVTMTAVVGYFTFRFLSLASFIGEFGGVSWILLLLFLLLVSTGIAVYFWFEFRRAWRAGGSR